MSYTKWTTLEFIIDWCSINYLSAFAVRLNAQYLLSSCGLIVFVFCWTKYATDFNVSYLLFPTLYCKYECEMNFFFPSIHSFMLLEFFIEGWNWKTDTKKFLIVLARKYLYIKQINICMLIRVLIWEILFEIF